MKPIVIGIGNLLRSDDGAGLHIVEALREENSGDKVDLRECLSGLDVLDAVRGYDRIIIVDAIMSGGEPGTLYTLSLKDLDEKHTLHSFSAHLNMDLPATIELGKKLFPHEVSEEITIVAVEAEDITTISDKCTPKVERAIPQAVKLIKRLLL